MSAKKTLRVHNRSVKPANIVEKEAKTAKNCLDIETLLPDYLHGYFVYLRGNVLPASRYQYLRDVRAFFQYLVQETGLTKAKEPAGVTLEEMKAINLRNVNERKRLKDEETFFDKKMEILKNGFAQLEYDKKAFEKEKAEYRQTHVKEEYVSDYGYAAEDFSEILFAGVNNMLALKKRYRDLLKIFHPDNLCGDNEIVAMINKEYDRLKRKYDYPFRSAK